MAGPNGYWLSSVFVHRSAAQNRGRTPAAHSRILVAAQPVRPAVRRTVQPAASSSQPGRPLGTFLVTCYDLAGITASGAPVGPEAVAVDPSIIPLGSHMYVQGAGNRIALDTGGAIKGRHLDIWAPSYTQCVDWGAQQRPVWLEG
jgi:3D (Asp-Asp-Asp) domain-containing protein